MVVVPGDTFITVGRNFVNISIAIQCGVFGGLVSGFINIHPLHGRDETVLRVGLDDALRIAATNNFALRAFEDRKIISRQILSEKWREYFPSIGLSVERRRTINKESQDIIVNEIRVDVEQILYDGGLRGMEYDRANLERILLGHDFQSEYSKLRIKVLTVYYGVLSGHGKARLNALSLERAGLQLKFARQEFELGLITDARLQQVASSYRQVELALLRTEHEYTRSLLNLNEALNLDRTVRLHPVEDLAGDFYLMYKVPDVEALIRHSIKNHSELIKARITSEQKKAAYEIEQKYWIPRISLKGYVGRSGVEYPLRDRLYGGSLVFTFPLGSNSVRHSGGLDSSGGGSNISTSSRTQIGVLDDMGRSRRYNSAKLAYHEALDTQQVRQRQLSIDIIRRLDKLKEAWQSIRLNNSRLYFQYRSVEMMQQRFDVGQIRRDEVLEAEINLITAQEEMLDVVVRYILAVRELEVASALDYDQLELVFFKEGSGNTVLPDLLRGDFKSMQRKIENRAESIDLDSITPGEREGEKFLIDEVELP